MTTYFTADQFTPIEDQPNQWKGPGSLGLCVGREGQTLQSFVDELNATLSAPAPSIPPVPSVVSAAQGRLALLNAGLLDQVKAAVEQADEATKIWFEYATEWRRDNAALNALGTQLGLSSGDIDDLFKVAAAL